MYSASADFHDAVKNGNHQMPLLIFKDAVFTSEDIDVNTGIEFDDLFCTEENISIGQALMNSIRFALFNDNQYLNDYEFGEFIATIGVRLTSTTYTQTGTISVTCGDNEYIAYSTSPYIKRNGTALNPQPSGKLANILIYKDTVYCYQEDGSLVTYEESTGNVKYILRNNVFDKSIGEWVAGYYINNNGGLTANSTYKYTYHFYPIKPDTTYLIHFTKNTSSTLCVVLYDKDKNYIARRIIAQASVENGTHNLKFSTTSNTAYIRVYYSQSATEDHIICEYNPRFMANKFKKKSMYGAYFNDNTNILTLNQNGVQDTYEFVPLGVFNANRPDAPSVSEITFACEDRMKRFEANMPSDTALGITYPTTIGTLYVAMCDYLDVPYETSTFINSTATIAVRPSQFDSTTMRTVLQWIAEAAGSNAKFNRDGELSLIWLNTTTAEYDEGDYSEFSPYWYETQKVSKLYNRDSQSSTDGTYGSGDGGYLILDNPLMKGAV